MPWVDWPVKNFTFPVGSTLSLTISYPPTFHPRPSESLLEEGAEYSTYVETPIPTYLPCLLSSSCFLLHPL